MIAPTMVILDTTPEFDSPEFYEQAASRLSFYSRENRIQWLKEFKELVEEKCASKP